MISSLFLANSKKCSLCLSTQNKSDKDIATLLEFIIALLNAFFGSPSSHKYPSKKVISLFFTILASISLAGDEELIGYSLAYTVNDNISVSVGSEELSRGVVTGTNVAFEGEKANITYTAGGMTLGATMASGDNISYSTAATEDRIL